MQSPALTARQTTQIRLTKLRSAPGVSLIGLPELIGLAGAAFVALATIFAYFYFYLPAQSRLASTQLERDRLQAHVRASQNNLQHTTSVREQVARITGSMSDFENNWLAAAQSGRMSLYTILNNVIKNNGLRNTAGPSYTPLAPVGAKAQVQPTASAEKQSNAKWQTIYPGIAVSVTVEGPYQRVRHFIRDIEASRQFLIINAVELESVTQSGIATELPPEAGTGTAPSAASAGGRGTLVSLRLEMATYFRRPQPENAP